MSEGSVAPPPYATPKHRNEEDNGHRQQPPARYKEYAPVIGF